MKSCRCWTARVGERRAVVGAGVIGEQVASELLVEVTILAVLFCCYFAHYYITNRLCLSTWVGLLSNGMGYF